MLHQVNKLQFEAICANEAQAFEVRQNLSQTCQQQVATVIDKVCTRYVSEKEWIKIDSIEIDLGYLSLQSYQDNFSNLLLEKFEKELSKKISAIPPAEKKASKQMAREEMLFYFLQTGTLPWWAGDESVDMETVFTEVATEKQAAVYNFLQQHKFTTPIWRRIAMQFNDAIHSQVIAFFPSLRLAEEKIMQWIDLAATTINETAAVANPNDANAVQWHKFILQYAPLFFGDVKSEGIIKQVAKQFVNEYNSILNVPISSAELTDRIIIFEKIKTNEHAEELITNTTKEKIEATEKENIAEPEMENIVEPEMEEKFTIHTAGTVLLAPYFKQLFARLNLLEQGQWKDAEANYKAIHLIRYMTTGQLMCPEHTLVLEKLLCGTDITAPVPKEVILSDEDKSEAMELLRSVIANWGKIKNTSVEGLRETFLKRDGILTKKENGWLLQVERKTVDVLLDGIPWSFATLAFTWNNYIIFTEW